MPYGSHPGNTVFQNRRRDVCYSELRLFQDVHLLKIGRRCVYETGIQFVDTFEENILGFCNNIFTQEGGTHLAGFKTKFTALINSYARELGILKDKDSNFTGADTRNGMTAVIAVKHPDPILGIGTGKIGVFIF